MEPLDSQRKLKRLRTTVWILAFLLGVTLVVSFVIIEAMSIGHSKFEHLSPEECIQAAGVIALAKYERSGGTLRCIISEILKQRPGTQFYWAVGDEFRDGNQRASENTDFGDGEVLFFTGSPPRLDLIAAYRANRITTFGNMPLDTLREMISTSK
jgi:hypothetical protein